MTKTTAILALLAFPVAGWAQVQVEPSYIVKKVAPGRPDKLTLTLKTELPRSRLWIQPTDYSRNRKGLLSIVDVKDKRFSAKAWCALPPTEVVVHKGRSTAFDVPVLVPHGTPGGEYYMALQVRVPVGTPSQESNFKVEYLFDYVVLVILEIPGGNFKLAGQFIEPQIRVHDNIPKLDATFQSLSTVSLIARAGVVVRNAERKVFDKFPLKSAGSQHEDGQAFMLPGDLRDFAGEGNRKLPPGRYVAEITATIGKEKVRCIKSVEFEVVGGDVTPVSPLEDIVVSPARPVLEIPAGGVKFHVATLKNRGFNAVDVRWAASTPGVTFFPQRVHLEPGQEIKVRVGVRLPATEDPRRDVPIVMQLEGEEPKERTAFTLSIFAPGTAPKEKP